MVHRIVHRVAGPAALAFWAERLAAEDVAVTRGDGASVVFADPEGLHHELVVATAPDAPLPAEHPDVPAEHALLGFEGVRAYSAAPERSAALLEGLMDATRRPDGAWELRGERRGGWIALDPAPAAPGRPSAGVVHHVAWGTSDAELPAWIRAVSDAGIPSSGYVDRHYFHSLYFREPGGVLYELATEEPGFTVDGPLEALGTQLILPPFLEARRAQIEARLTPLPDPNAGRPRRTSAESTQVPASLT